MSLYTTLRPALFLLPPEKAHRAAICALQRGLVPPARATHANLKTTVAGLSFENPVGLAPGFDKNAECFEGALNAGCGFVEIGTVTPRPQAGNPAPRVFRLVEHEAIINRLGFNNEGMDAAVARLAKRSGRGIIGGNIGKNKESADAVADYTAAMRTLYPHVDYITANISSPNTPGLRALQAADELKALIEALQKLRAELENTPPPRGGSLGGGHSEHAGFCDSPLRVLTTPPPQPSPSGGGRKPIFVKIAPDCDDAMLEAIAQTALVTGLDGLIVSNTTLSREAVANSPHAKEAGGLSGKPLFALSTEALRKTYCLTGGKIPLIGVGGIASAADAYEKICAGASLVQLYSALIYKGFGLVNTINNGLSELLARDGFASVSDAVGMATRRG